MILRNLSLALGLITASAAGMVVTKPIVGNNRNVSVNREFAKLGDSVNKKRRLLKPNTLGNLWHDICVVNKLDETQFTENDQEKNLEHLFKFYQIDDESISCRKAEEKLYSNKNDSNNTEFPYTGPLTTFVNETDAYKTITAPEMKIKAAGTTLMTMVNPLKPSKARIYGTNVDLSKSNILRYSNIDAVTYTFPAQQFVMKPHSTLVVGALTRNYVEFHEGSFKYEMNWNDKQNIKFQSMNGANFANLNIGSTLEKIANRSSEKINMHNFTDESKDLFIFEKGDYYPSSFSYNIPIYSLYTLQRVKYFHENIDKN